MTRRRSCDYSAVFDFLLQQVRLPKVQEVMSDFERAVFTTVATKLRQVQHHGCNFHWCQAVMKKVRDLGLYTDFCRGGPIQDAINFILTLPLLPANKIRAVFAFWTVELNLPVMSPLISYVNRNWVNGSCWCPEKWSVYNMAVRTDNDAEGKHHWWNSRGKGKKLSFYELTDHLYTIASEVPLIATLLAHDRIERYVRKSQNEKNNIIYGLWDDYVAGKFNTYHLWEQLVAKLKTNLHAVYSTLDDDDFCSEPYDYFDMDLPEPTY